MKQAHIRVPATTANIGPGFDCLGAALSLYADFSCALQSRGLEITGCPSRYCNENNLFMVAYRKTENCLGIKHTGLQLNIRTDVPISRGLGSSATLLAAGACACFALHDMPVNKQTVLEVCNDIEGHPDNVAPCIMGGMRISMVIGGRPDSLEVPVAENIGFIALIPDVQVSTQMARGVLPSSYTRADAVFNISHLGVLLRGFETGDLALAGRAMDDRLHQPYREDLIPNYAFVKQAALDCGASGFVISGSGSTCLAVCDRFQSADIASAIRERIATLPDNWQTLPLELDREGAHVEQ